MFFRRLTPSIIFFPAVSSLSLEPQRPYNPRDNSRCLTPETPKFPHMLLGGSTCVLWVYVILCQSPVSPGIVDTFRARLDLSIHHTGWTLHGKPHTS